MKSEERHQLLTNDLGVVTTKTVGFFEQHAATMIAVVLGVLVAFGIGYWWTSAAETDSAAGWTMLDSARGVEELGAVVDKYKGKVPGHWAQLQISEKTLQSAMPLMFSNREIAITDVKRSREGFESLLQDKAISPAIRERAVWGLALCLETGCDGDTTKPIAAFERLLSDFPDSIFKPVAEERIAALKNKGAAEFYTWFSKEKPQPPEARPRDFKTDAVHLPAPGGGDDDPDDFVPKTSQKPQVPVNPAPAAEGSGDKAPNPNEKPDGDSAKRVEGEKPTVTDPPKDGEKPGEKD